MTELSSIDAVGLYFIGIVVGIMLTLWWQAYSAAIRRQMWDNVSKAYDRMMR